MKNTEFHKIKVKNIQQSTKDCVIVEFDIPNSLKEKFQFKAGQYLTLRKELNGEEVRRSYSLCSSPIDNTWQVGIKEIEGGKFSTFANQQLKVGDTLEAMVPNGSFTLPIDKNNKKNYIAFAAGSGITPMVSLIKTQLAEEPNATFKLFYTNKTVGSIILKEELEALKNKHMERFEIFYFLTKEKRNIPFLNGRIDDEKLNTIFSTICAPENVDEVLSCGPQEMIFKVRDYLLDKGFPKDKIHFELFTTDGTAHKKQAEKLKKTFKGKTSNITILEGGKSFNFEMEQGSNNILDEALINSADLPFACKGGVCATCKCKLIEGDVNMLLSYGLEDEEVEAGYILSCQSIPTTDKIIIDFDV
ncbi:MAG: phenylacetate-CoA oxygenase/reductase subunit PaaK [Saprospiraceae bacterium]|nr:phenylacetate-CoA oxygenase/reductase subunit PaaK [Saprospiraceae bacterium]